MTLIVALAKPDRRRRPRSEITLQDLDAARPVLSAGRGWPAAVQATIAARRAAGDATFTTSRRAIRRALEARGLPTTYPRSPVYGHRPRKPEFTDEECKLAIAAAEDRGPKGAPNWAAAARLISQWRGADAVQDPAERARRRVSARWVQLRLQDQVPARRP